MATSTPLEYRTNHQSDVKVSLHRYSGDMSRTSTGFSTMLRLWTRTNPENKEVNQIKDVEVGSHLRHNFVVFDATNTPNKTKCGGWGRSGHAGPTCINRGQEEFVGVH